ncbi:MAG: FGGY-family carbohydrate kinase [Sulfuriferula sp.]
MYYLGLDFGTSGARGAIIDTDKIEVWSASISYPEPQQQTPHDWDTALLELLGQIPPRLRTGLRAIAIDGTSGTVLLADAAGRALTPALLYSHPLANDPAGKLKWLKQNPVSSQPCHLMHQVDYLNVKLGGRIGISDYHNALKSGLNVLDLTWRNGIYNTDDLQLLPRIVKPGTVLGNLHRRMARHFNLNPHCVVRAGTTDSIAAFIAAGVSTPGYAVTSLGTTLVLKLLSTRYVEAPEYGVYSHKFGDLWLVGGASNSGGAVLRQFFSDEELVSYSLQIQPEIASELDYYPLPRSGERFPINDPQFAPRLAPRPDNKVTWLHGLLEGIAKIEHRGYVKLAELGATPLQQVFTAGGGSKNQAWQAIRQRQLGVPVTVASHIGAAYGSALIAQNAGSAVI